MKSKVLLLAACVLTLTLVGCKTTKSVAAKPLQPVYQTTDLSRYDVATVQPLAVNSAQAANDQAGVTLANDIAHRLEYDFGPLFQTVRVGEPLGVANEVVVTGKITDYRPGSRAARLLGPGIGRADLKGDLVLKDGATGQPVMIAPIHKLWAWGHSIGAAKGMNNMMEETAASAAHLVARARGWQPPPTQASVAR